VNTKKRKEEKRREEKRIQKTPIRNSNTIVNTLVLHKIPKHNQ
jgi:hypothetical protein